MQDDKDFKDYIETLPAELKQAIYSIDYPQKLQEIVKNNKLMIDQAGKLEAETTLVMAGIVPLDKYISNLIGNVGLSNIQASVVAHYVNETIFKNIRESLKKINDQIAEEDKIISETEKTTKNGVPSRGELPTKEDIMTGIENPENIKNVEESVSLSSLQSNSLPAQAGAKPETHEMIEKGIEIRINNLPEIAPKAILPTVSSLIPKKPEPFHINIPPVENIVEAKLNNTVIVPKQTIVVEEKTKLPEKSRLSTDPYRESTI